MRQKRPNNVLYSYIFLYIFKKYQLKDNMTRNYHSWGQKDEKPEALARYVENIAKLYLNFGTKIENILSQITLLSKNKMAE